MAAKSKTSVPNSNPDVGRPTIGHSEEVEGLGPTTHIDGEEFLGELPDHAGEPDFFYWVGVTPSCPVESIDLAGVSFPKMTDIIRPAADGLPARRYPQAGTVTRLSLTQVKLLRERMRNVVIRFRETPEQRDEPGTGENIGDIPHVRRRNSILIRVPTEKELAERRKAGLPAEPYRRNPKTDRPASMFMFAVLCPDQTAPAAGTNYPKPLCETGLEWPGEIPEDLLA